MSKAFHARRRFQFFSVIAFLILLTPGTLQAKTTGPQFGYRYNRAAETFDIQSDGSVRVTELLTMLYDGSYHSMWRILPTGTSTMVSDVEVLDGATGIALTQVPRIPTGEAPESWGTYAVTNTENVTRVSWAYNTSDRVHTWVLHYTLRGALTFLSAHDEFFWTLFANYDVPVDTVETEVYLPRPVLQPSATIFTTAGHDYYIDRPDQKTFRFRVSDIAPGERVVIKVDFEKGIVHPNLWWPLLVVAFEKYKWPLALIFGLLGTLTTYIYVWRPRIAWPKVS